MTAISSSSSAQAPERFPALITGGGSSSSSKSVSVDDVAVDRARVGVGQQTRAVGRQVDLHGLGLGLGQDRARAATTRGAVPAR